MQQQTWLTHFKTWQQKLKKSHIRGVILSPISLELPAFIVATKQNCQSRIIDSQNLNLLNTEKLESFLGTENQIIIFDASQEFDSNTFAAITGSLVGGGLLILQLAEHDYANVRRSFYKAKIETTKHIELSKDPLLNRLLLAFQNNQSTAVLDSDTKQLQPPLEKPNFEFDYKQELLSLSDCDIISNSNIINNAHLPNSHQQDLIAQIKRVATGHANRPLVITASRGRGKSSALGIAAAELITQYHYSIVVTAPSKNNLNSFYQQLFNNFDSNQINWHHKSKNEIQIELQATSEPPLIKTSIEQTSNTRTTVNSKSIKFIAVDELIRTKQPCQLLIIDEAAAIPVTQLQQLTHKYNRVVFSTTTDGYEGNGKGFELRFKKHLVLNKPQTRFTTLTQPVRWSSQDELEISTFNALLLNAELPELPELPKVEGLITHNEKSGSVPLPLPLPVNNKAVSTTVKPAIKHFTTQLLSKKYLRRHEAELSNIFALLISAHYQTRPADLQAILTNPNLDVFVTFYHQTIIAVALVSREGLFSQQESNQIAAGEKRVKGHLSPQSILVNFGLEAAGQLSYYRVMRIAVHPEWQNNAMGSMLLADIIADAQTKNIDCVSTSYSIELSVLNFWLKNNFKGIRFASSKESATGSHSLEMLLPLSVEAEHITKPLFKQFVPSLIYKLKSELKDIDVNIVQSLLLTHQLLQDQITSHQLQEIDYFCHKKRSYSAVDYQLQLLFLYNLSKLNGYFEPTEINFLISTLIKQESILNLSCLYLLKGKKQVLQKLRDLASKLLRVNKRQQSNRDSDK
jgi:tRNA(Met) cytidine acetyltransferase